MSKGEQSELTRGEKTMAIKRKLLTVLGLMQLTLGTSAGLAEEAPRIKISFVLVSDIIGPRPITGHHRAFSATLNLSGRNEVAEDWERVSLAGQRPTWRMLSSNTIQGTWRMSNYTKTVTVRVTGKSCTVVFDTQLDPAYYRSGNSSHTKPKMIDPVCTVEG